MVKCLIFHPFVHKVSNAICTACASRIINASKSVGDQTHSAAQLFVFLGDAVLVANNESLGILALEVALILQA